MAEELEQIQEESIEPIQEQTTQEQTQELTQQPPSKASQLYKTLIADGYTKQNLGNEEDFVKKVTTKEGATKLHSTLLSEGYTEKNLGNLDGFTSNLMSTQQQAQPPVQKKKEFPTLESFGIDTKNFYKQPAVSTYVAPKMTPEIIAQTEAYNKKKEIAIDNTTQRALKNKKISAAKNSPTYNAQRKKIEQALNDGDAVVTVDPRTQSPALSQTLNPFESFWASMSSAFNAEDEAKEFANMTPEQRVEYVNKMPQFNKEGYMGEVPSGTGKMIGEAVPFVLKMGAGAAVGAGLTAIAPETGGASLQGLTTALPLIFTMEDMVLQGGQKEVIRQYNILKEQNEKSENPLSDIELMKQAEKGYALGATVGGLTNVAFGFAGEIGGKPLQQEAQNVLGSFLKNGIKGTAKSAATLGTVSAAGEVSTIAAAGLQDERLKRTAKQTIDAGVDAFVGGATVGAVLHTATGIATGIIQAPGIIKSAVKYALSKENPASLASVLKANEDVGNVPEGTTDKVMTDILEYNGALSKTSQDLSPETQASVAGLIQKRDKLVSEMSQLDPTQVDSYKQQVDSINEQIKNITNTNSPFEFELNQVGQKLSEAKPIEGNVLEVPEVKEQIDDLNNRVNQGGVDAEVAKKELELISSNPVQFFEQRKQEAISKSKGVDPKDSNIDEVVNNYDALINKLKEYDTEDITGLPSEIGKGEEPIQAEPVESRGAQEVSDDRILQENVPSGEGEVGKVAQGEIEAKKADIERRRQEELSKLEDSLNKDLEEANKQPDRIPTIKVGNQTDNQTIRKTWTDTANSTYEYGVKRANAKYDAELKALEEAPVPSEVKQNEVTEEEYNNFIDKGKVSPERLNDIAQKVKNREELSDREKEIFTDKTADINKIIAELPVPTEAKAVETTEQKEKKNRENTQSKLNVLSDEKFDEVKKKAGYSAREAVTDETLAKDYHDALKVLEPERTEKQNKIVSAVNEALGTKKRGKVTKGAKGKAAKFVEEHIEETTTEEGEKKEPSKQGEPVGAPPVQEHTVETIDQADTTGFNEVQKKTVNDAKKILRAVSNLVAKTTGKKLKVFIHSTRESAAKAVYESTIKAGGTEADARANMQNQGNRGWWSSADGEIHLNIPEVSSETIQHEATHPILDAISKSNPEIIDRFHKQLEALPEGKELTDLAKKEYAVYDENGKLLNESEVKIEAITDYIAKVADGQIKIDASNFQKVKEYIVNLLTKIGLSPEVDIRTIEDLRKLAQTVSEKFAKGEEIKIDNSESYIKKAETSKTSEGIDNDISISDIKGESDRGVLLSKQKEKVDDETIRAVKTSIINYKDVPKAKIARTLFYDNTRVGDLEIKNRNTGYTPKVVGKGGFFYSYMPESLKNKAVLAFTSVNQAIQTLKRQMLYPDAIQAIAAQNFQTAHLGNKSTLKALFGEKGSKDLGIFQESVKNNPEGEAELLNTLKTSTINVANQKVQSGVNQGQPTSSAIEIKKIIDRNGGTLDNIKSLNDFRDKVLTFEGGDSFGARNILFTEILQEKPTKITKSTRDSHQIMHYKYGIPTLSEIAEGNNQKQLNNAETGDVIKFVKPYSEPIVYTTDKNIYEQYSKNPTPEMVENGIKIELLPSEASHESYPFVLKGENVGVLDNYVSATQLYEKNEKIAGTPKKQSFYKVGRMPAEALPGEYPSEPIPQGKFQFSKTRDKKVSDMKDILKEYVDEGKSLDEIKDIMKDEFGDYYKDVEKVIEQAHAEMTTTGIKNAVTERERAERGLAEVEVEAKRSFGDVFDDAKKMVADGKTNGLALAAEIVKNPRPLKAEESAVLLIDRMRISNEYNKKNAELLEAQEKGETEKVDIIQSQMEVLEQEMDLNDEAARKSGYEQGLGLAARRMLIAQDYSLVTQMNRLKAANGGKEVPKKYQEQLNDLIGKLDEANKKLEKLEKNEAATEKQRQLARVKSVARTTEQIAKEKESIKNKIVSKWGQTLARMKAAVSGIKKAVSPTPISPAKQAQLESIVEDVNKMVKLYAESGETNLRNIIDNVHADLVGSIPDLELSDVKDIITGVYDKEKVKTPLSPQKIQAQANVRKVKTQIDMLKEELKNKQRSVLEKGTDYLHGWHRFSILSGIPSLGKIGMAALSRGVVTRGENIVGKAMSLIPGISRIAKKAPRQGGLSVKAEAKAFTTWFDKMTRQDLMQTMKTGVSEIDYLYGKKEPMSGKVPEWMEFFGRLHSAMKLLPKRAEFFRSLEMRTEHALENGKDINDPVVQQEMAAGAYNDALRAIFMQDNIVTEAYTNTINKLNEKHPALASALKFALPIVKVPTNYVSEAFAYVPVISGLNALTTLVKGRKGMTPEQADYFMRQMKKGAIGTAVIFMGFMNPQAIGGYYTGKRKKDDLEAGDIELFGTKLPHFMLHTPLLEMLQIGATMRRAYDARIKKGEEGSVIEGIPAAFKGLGKQVPFFGTGERISTALEKEKSRDEYLYSLGKSILDPQMMQNLADWTDTQEGKVVKRKTETFTESLKEGIPGLRKTLKEDKAKFTDKEYQEFSQITEKGFNIPELNKRTSYKVKINAEHPDGHMTEDEFDKFISLQKEYVKEDYKLFYKKHKGDLDKLQSIIDAKPETPQEKAEMNKLKEKIQNKIDGIHSEAISKAKSKLKLNK
jgi:hypothetical protein